MHATLIRDECIVYYTFLLTSALNPYSPLTYKYCRLKLLGGSSLAFNAYTLYTFGCLYGEKSINNLLFQEFSKTVKVVILLERI